MSFFHVKLFFLVVFSPLTRACSPPDVPEVLHMQRTSLCSTEQLPSLLKQTLADACKFVVSVFNLRSSQITSASNVCWYMLSNHNFKRGVNKRHRILDQDTKFESPAIHILNQAFVVRMGFPLKGS